MAKIVLNYNPADINERTATFAVPGGKYLLKIKEGGYKEGGTGLYIRTTVLGSETGEWMGTHLESIFVNLPETTEEEIKSRGLAEEQEKLELRNLYFRKRDIADLMRACNLPLVSALDTDDLSGKIIMAELVRVEKTIGNDGKPKPARNQLRQTWPASEWKVKPATTGPAATGDGETIAPPKAKNQTPPKPASAPTPDFSDDAEIG